MSSPTSSSLIRAHTIRAHTQSYRSGELHGLQPPNFNKAKESPGYILLTPDILRTMPCGVSSSPRGGHPYNDADDLRFILCASCLALTPYSARRPPADVVLADLQHYDFMYRG